jgi:hypothetical protein
MTVADDRSGLPQSGGTSGPRTNVTYRESGPSAGRRMRVWHIWVCLALSSALVTTTLLWFGLSLWTMFVIVVLLTCPAVMVWSYVIGQRPLPFPIGSVPETRGITTNWAAPYYDSFCLAIGLGPAFRERTLAAARAGLGDHVLDIGCGTGVLTRMAAAAVGPRGSALGIDPAPDMIRIARQNAAIEGSSARFLPGAIEHRRSGKHRCRSPESRTKSFAAGP